MIARPSAGVKSLKPQGSAQKVTSRVGVAANSRKTIENTVDLKDAVSHDEDPIAASLKGRMAAGGMNVQLKDADVKKQKMHVPAPLNLASKGKDALI